MNQIVDKNGNPLIIEAFHPGEFLLEEIEERGMLKKDVAKELGILPHHLSDIFAGKRNISAKLAIKLEKLLGVLRNIGPDYRSHMTYTRLDNWNTYSNK